MSRSGSFLTRELEFTEDDGGASVVTLIYFFMSTTTPIKLISLRSTVATVAFAVFGYLSVTSEENF